MQKRLLLLMLLCAVSPLLWAGNQIRYTASEKLPEVTNISASGLHINSFNSSITSHTFSNGEGLVVFTDEVTVIGDYAFYECTGLSSITIPDSVMRIGDHAFTRCDSLISVNIPENVTSIGDFAFCSCKCLSSITIPNGVTSIGNFVFQDCRDLISINIPDSVTNIGECAFYGCRSLTSVSIPKSVTSIGMWAFSECTNLTSITIPSSVTSIGDDAFCLVVNIDYSGTASGAPWGARSMNGYIDDCLIYKDSQKTALLGCLPNTLGDITIPNSVTSIGRYTFYFCTGLTSITIPNSVNSIGYHAFSNCSSLTSITIPNSVTRIEYYAFSNCSSLATVTIPNSVTSIEYNTFYECTALTSVTIPNSVTSIGDYAFYNCKSLNSITIPNGVTGIGEHAFFGCTSLSSLNISNSALSIGDNAFQYCVSLTSVTIPGSVKSIGKRAFNHCDGLNSVTISDGVTNIGERAFLQCESLSTISIPNSITSIGYGAFLTLPKLQEIICFATTPPYLPTNPFTKYDAILKVPAESIDKYRAAYGWQNFSNISSICAETTDPTTDVKTMAGNNEVTIIWPTTDNAVSYTIEVFKTGTPFHTLVFNSDGVLVSIEYENTPQNAPTLNGNSTPQRASLTNSGMKFTITGLDYGTQYTYKIVSSDANGQELASYQGSFATNGPTAMEGQTAPYPETGTSRKVFIDGQLYILRDGIIYSPTGYIVR